VKWFRKHVKLGSRLALFAFAIQFALSFGHFHAIGAQAAPSIGLTQADFGIATALDAASETAQKQQPSTPDNDQQPADACAICAVIALAGNLLLAAPPVLVPPQAVELTYLTTDAAFVDLNPARLPFQSRAPPIS
jgi:hypothetical protein